MITGLFNPAGEAEMHTTTNDSERGLYEKFRVERTDGRSAEGEKHDGCEYFVLGLDHDPHALAALHAYAVSCWRDYPLLAADLDRKVTEKAAR